MEGLYYHSELIPTCWAEAPWLWRTFCILDCTPAKFSVSSCARSAVYDKVILEMVEENEWEGTSRSETVDEVEKELVVGLSSDKRRTDMKTL